ncbi:hypothetical protein BaOVIS_025350 [Babesia ovis]|uniref:Uncharacterized protein n=1 Tax=Babesia ovis TaxID=5869 RepID=A0A9W5TD15_BABOV|nr:hypothetical protein BaOVIS_025350 [Babesia ovis]
MQSGKYIILHWAFLSAKQDRVSFNRYTKYNGGINRQEFIRHSSAIINNSQDIAAKGTKDGQGFDFIVGGDLDTPPGLLHNTETPEIREFTKDMWERQVPLEEAVERLNMLDEVQPASVMDNLMYGNNGQAEGAHGGSHDNKADSTANRTQDNKHNGVDVSEQGVSSLKVVQSETQGNRVPGYVAPTEYIDEEQYHAETSKMDSDYNSMDASLKKHDEYSDEEDDDGLNEVNYSALTKDEKRLVFTLMHSKLEEPETHEEIVRELISGDIGGLTEEECRGYFDKFQRVGDILIGLNKTVHISPLQTEWIPEFQMRMGKFVASRGYRIASIRWTKHDVIVELKDVITEEETESLHRDLVTYMQTEAGAEVCPGVKNLGLLLYTATPEEDET